MRRGRCPERRRAGPAYAEHVDNWVGILVGVALIGLVVSDRDKRKERLASPREMVVSSAR